MQDFLKKILISSFIAITMFLSIAPILHVRAEDEWYSQNPIDWYVKVYDPTMSPPNEIFGERYTAAQVQWITYSFLFMPVRAIEQVVGEGSVTCFLKAFGSGSVDIGTCTTGALGVLDKIKDFVLDLNPTASSGQYKSIASIVTESTSRDISGIGYTKSLINKLSPVSVVNAQGYGYEGISWVQKYWKGFRDMSYTLLILVVIVFAFMIIFRVKLSPQTVISVQSALPKVVVAMILITFSYAIAGFAIDLMYVVAGIFAFLLKSAGFATNINAAFGAISGTGAGYAIAGGFWVFFEMLAYTVMFFIAALIAALGQLISGINIFGVIIGIVFMIIAVWLLVLTIWYTIKIPYILIKTLISIYLSIITAPVQILAGTLAPSMGFGNWFKRLMSDILVYPIVGLLFWFAWAMLWSAYKAIGVDVWNYYASTFGPSANSWIPEMIGSKGFGHNSGMSAIVLLGISFGLITLVPKVPDMLKSILMGEKFSMGMAIGEATGVAKTAWGLTGSAYVSETQKQLGHKGAEQRAEKIQNKVDNILSRFKKPRGTT